MSALPPLARCAAAALAVAAVARLASPALALFVALVVAPVLARHAAPAHLAAIAVALRSFLPDPPNPLDLAGVRDALAWPLHVLLPSPDASIAVATLLGGTQDVPREVRDAFTKSGTAHLMAASGFNITLLAAAVSMVLRPIGARAVALATVGAAVALAVAAGLAPSIVRAAVMSLAASAAVLAGRPASGIGTLGAAVLVLLAASPDAVGDVGFLLSISATAGLLCLATPLERRLPGPTWLRAQLAATGAATFASLPVSAAAFGRVSLVSPLANLAAAPLVPPLMLATGVAIAAGSISLPLAAVPGWIAFALARALRAVVETAAAVPLASVSSPHAGAAVLAVYALGFVAVRMPAARRRLIVAAIALAALLTAGSLVAAAGPRERVVALDVGQGDAFLLEAGGAHVLVDGGPDPPRTVRTLAAVLAPGTSYLDAVVLTHSHADHAAGLTAVLARYAVGVALEPAGLEANVVAAEWHAALSQRAVPLRALARGDRLRIGEIVLEVLAPFGDPLDALPNLALRARVGSITALLLGDASERGQEDLLLHPAELRADVYAPPHHGAATPLAAALVSAASPAVALISVGAANRYGHPAPDTLRALSGVRTMRTDRDGTLEVRRDGNTLRCVTRATALPRPWDGWLSRPPPCA